MPKTLETVLEIDLNALEHNFKYLKSRLKPDTKFLAVVKAFAYGSEATSIAKKMEALGIDYFAVAYTKEGIALRKAGIGKPILVLHPQPIHFDALIENCLEPSLYSPKILKEFIAAAKQNNQKNYPVHIKFNTGLNRLGFSGNDVDYILNQLKDREELKITSILSHLAATEDPNEREFTLKQIDTFTDIALEFEEKLGYSPLKHILNTSGIINYPEAQFNMVRSGIGLYGLGNEPDIDSQLKPVMTLKTVISQIHKIEPHESVGYNRAYSSNTPRVTATLPIGHADGIGRQYGNGKAFVNVNGKMAPIIGNVCMDMIMIDVTDIQCAEGDEVIIFGKHPNADTFAAYGNTISYELLTAISQRVTRVLKGE
ncbi:alanine racemase [Maribacter sp. ANRC-HE7]|uniref:Alanine racemase n=1 Tax=Maribacter aquimaris TaxID=2737171 RepID=A0ABR7V5H5_9FLAO|nr:alanine racemase [Maribacter aquimaris]MBD0779906.1 alanine racemase [Maribacter aquimaris]